MGLGAIFAVLGAGVLFYYASPKPGVAALPEHSHEEGAAAHEHDEAGGGWAVDYGASSLNFTGSENGRKFEGSFQDFAAVIDFDPDDLANAAIAVTVKTASASTGDSLRDSNLPGSEWFAIKDYPEATFASTAITEADEGYAAEGVLRIKEFEKPVTLYFDVVIDGDKAHATGGADLLRTDFGLGKNASWLEEEGIAVEVRVEFEIHATRKD
jgi:polyisoprenoid-binding protein YceI